MERITDDKYVKVLKKKYSRFVFGIDEPIRDEYLLGYITKEVGFLIKTGLQVFKRGNFWFINAEDWVSNFTNNDLEYLFSYDVWYGFGYLSQVSGVVLSAFSNGVGLALDGKITASYNLTEEELSEISNEIEFLKNRVVFFKSVENYENVI
ncbi:hypothetical protein [Acinetobacter gerneri]|uniref:hypothetical protein n=1 Tax=Acinetobacter gerneri TaxID=202952 RepID=UPI0028B03969|nr:hypothetical protein [Acinetobacter gerneri]